MYKWAFVAILGALSWNFVFRDTKPPPVTPLEVYDYIVVGAGSAGGVVSTRLSENSKYTVALLEAGPDNDEFPDSDVPRLMWSLQKTDLDWQYETVPQKHSCQGLVGKKSAWPRGKSLGGTSLINGMMVTRGNKEDYDYWAELGNTDWSYEKVLPFFKKIETASEKEEWRNSGYRGQDGPVSVEEIRPLPELADAVLKSAELFGYNISDINDDEQIGMMLYQANVKRGRRASTAKAYIKPAMTRPNFHVITRAHVTKVMIEGKRAVGVQYMQDGRMKTLRARKEIILSAGAIGSPQILMLSGIGPKKHLEELGIPVIEDLPVGQNMYDHIMTDAPVYTLEKPVAIVGENVGVLADLEYKLFGTGPFSTCGCLATGFDRSKVQPKERKNPYIQYILFGNLLGNHKDDYDLMQKVMNIDPKVFEPLNSGLEGTHGLTMAPNLIQPYSVGEIRLKSSNPFDYPLIDPNYLSDIRDVQILVDAIRKSQAILEQQPLQDLGVKQLKRINPLCKDHKFDSDDYWACYVRSNTLTVYHPVGTCKMAPDGDPTSVVDGRLRVRNIPGLRVADASIMPYIMSGNTNFPCMMIGEKVADMLKKDA